MKTTVMATLTVMAMLTATGCAARQQVIETTPVVEVAVVCETLTFETTVFVFSPEEARQQVESDGWRPIEVRQATLEPNGVREGVWIVRAERQVCQPAS